MLKEQPDLTYSRAQNISAWITQQLKRCTQEHPNCQDPEISYLPDRVLDVGLIGQDSVRLKITNDGSNLGRYLTLSHRWGDAEFVTLTAANESSLKEQIRILDLPQTFRDAIEVTRSVGLKYLWIDSLCIRQDSPADWREQSAKMGTIYRNCYFNIAATAASDSGVGLFAPQNPLVFLPAYVRANSISMFDEEGIELLEFDRTVDEYNIIAYGKTLHHRAWVFQERLLSPRVVNFGEGGIVWECWEKVILEHNNLKSIRAALGGWVPQMAEFIDIKSFPKWLEALSKEVTESPDSKASLMVQTYNRWHSLVCRYSNTSITKSDDKLVAISGLADLVRRNLQSEYLAGLWRGNLSHDLLWVVDIKIPSLPNPSTSIGQYITSPKWADIKDPSIEWADTIYLDQVFTAQEEPDWRAPTWSWAHLDAPVFFKTDKGADDEYRIMITLLDSHIIPMGDDICGQLKSAQLILRGPLLEVKESLGYSALLRGMEIKADRESWIVYPDTMSTVEKLRRFEGGKSHLKIMPILVVQNVGVEGLLLEHDELHDRYRRLGEVHRDQAIGVWYYMKDREITLV